MRGPEQGPPCSAAQRGPFEPHYIVAALLSRSDAHPSPLPFTDALTTVLPSLCVAPPSPQFLVPREKEELLAPFVRELQTEASRLFISDIHISLTTLEEVFLKASQGDGGGGGH